VSAVACVCVFVLSASVFLCLFSQVRAHLPLYFLIFSIFNYIDYLTRKYLKIEKNGKRFYPNSPTPFFDFNFIIFIWFSILSFLFCF